jgi:hypothetical protein
MSLERTVAGSSVPRGAACRHGALHAGWPFRGGLMAICVSIAPRGSSARVLAFRKWWVSGVAGAWTQREALDTSAWSWICLGPLDRACRSDDYAAEPDHLHLCLGGADGDLGGLAA